MWRKLHRWISILAAVYLLNMAITGSLLAWNEWSLRLPGGNLSPEKLRAAATPQALPDIDMAAAAQSAYLAAQVLAPDAPMSALRMSMANGRLQGAADFSGPYPGRIVVRAADGKRLSSPPGPTTPQSQVAYHQLLKRFHRGDFIGSFSGRYMSITAGFCLLFLSISGIVMYFDLRRARSQRGKRQWFWS
ncbi:MAG: PepSY-associated TM helix domain-containing protein [Steroidobacteraceae bacterium]